MISRFRLSRSGRVAAAISLSLVCAQPLWAGGIEPAAGSNMKVDAAPGGVDIVTIAPVNGSGLSHNLANRWDIGEQGAVLNNAMRGGTSQLGGKLDANLLLGGRAASVILAEVVSRNPSLLLGKQEIFGQAADFVLANPNGITCNGCGFINTSRASLLVGSPLLADGRLQGMQSARNGAALAVGPAGIGGVDVLDLIAPRINAQGTLVAVSGINAISGNVRVDYASGKVDAVAAATGVPLDSAYLGGMQAGRIKIVSTDEGAGVNLGGVLHATDTLGIKTHGQLDLAAADLKGAELTIAANAVSAHGRVDASTRKDATHEESWFIWQTGATDTGHTVERSEVARSRLEGNDVAIEARREVALSATDVMGGNVRVKAGEIVMGGEQELERDSTDYTAWKNSWQHQQHKEQESLHQVGSSLEARQDIRLDAEGGITLQGARVTAGNALHMNAGKDLKLSGLVDQERNADQGSRYLEGAGLETGSWNTHSEQQRLKATELTAGQSAGLSAANDLNLQGARLAVGGDLAMVAGHSIDIGTQVIHQNRQVTEQSMSWGGLAGSDHQNDNRQQQENVASGVTAQGALSLQAEHDIRVTGSQLEGGRGARAETRSGSVEVEHAMDVTLSTIDEGRNGAFNIPLTSESGKSDQQVAQGARVASDSDLRVASGAAIDVTGSSVSAAQKLELNAHGHIQLAAAEQNGHAQQSDSRWQIAAKAGLDDQGRRVAASLGLTNIRDVQEREQTTHEGASLSGGSVMLAAQGDIGLKGSQVTALAGDVALSGSNLNVGAVYDQGRTSRATDSTTGGVQVSAQAKGVGAGVGVSGKHSLDVVDSRVARGSRVTAAGNLSLDAAAGKLATEGATFSATGVLTVNAGQIDNLAATSVRNEHQEQTNWTASQGQNVDFSALADPVSKVISELKNGQFTQAKADAGKIVDAAKAGAGKLKSGDWSGALAQLKKVGLPEVNSEILVNGTRQSARQKSEGASGSQFSGAQVRVKSSAGVIDQGSIYQAGAGPVVIAANSHQFDAAVTQSTNQTQEQRWDVALGAASSTGHDLALKVGVGVTDSGKSDSVQAAQTGAIMASNGIDVTLGQNGHFQGTHLDAGQGALKVTAGGDLRIDAAPTAQTSQQSKLGGALAADLTLSANPAKSYALGGGGQLTWDGAVSGSAQQGAEVAVLAGQGGVGLRAGHDLTLAGSQVNGGSQSEVALAAGGHLDIQAVGQSNSHDGWRSSGEISGALRAQNASPSGVVDIKVGVDRDAHSGSSPASIEAGKVSLDSGRDLKLAGGVVRADVLSGHVGGDLQVASLKDNDSSLHVDVALGGNTPNLSKIVSKDGVTLNGKLQVDRSALDAVTAVSRLTGRTSVDLPVAGQTTLTGARIESGGPLPAGPVALQTVPGSSESSKGGLEFSGTPIWVITRIGKDVLAGKPPLGLNSEHRSEDRTVPSSIGKP